MMRRRPIVYLTLPRRVSHGGVVGTCVWHVAWCRMRRGARVYTSAIAPGDRRYRYPVHWVYEQTRRGDIRAAMNGAVYNQSVVPSLPIGGVGEGAKGWKTWSEATNKKFCFGMTADGRPTQAGLPAYAIDSMALAYSKTGTSADNMGQQVDFYTVSTKIRRNYPYGFGCVGVLVKPGGWPVYNSVAGGWQNGQSLGPYALLSRTVLAWTRDGDFFLISCTGRDDEPRGFIGADWGDTINFVDSYLPKALATEYGWMSSRRHRHKRIDGAVMLDGGGSTMFGYEHMTRRGSVNLDRGAPHGPSGDAAQNEANWPLIPDFVYAVARSRD